MIPFVAGWIVWASLAVDSGPAAAKEPEFKAELAKLLKVEKEGEERVYAEFGEQYDAAKSDAERAEVTKAARRKLVEHAEAARPVQENLLRLLRPSAADPEAAEGLCYLAFHAPPKVQDEAAALVRRHHLAHPAAVRLGRVVFHTPRGWVDSLLREQISAKSIAEDDRARLQFSLAKHLAWKSELPAKIAGDPDCRERYGDGVAAELGIRDVGRLEAEAVALFEEVARTHGGVTYLPDPAGITLGELAAGTARELKTLGVGKAAPDIDGEDLDGAKLRLSDFRGRVVVLAFWGSRCTPCMALVPHERSLVERFRGQPFEMLGVNCDADRADARPAVKAHKITWRSFWGEPKEGAGWGSAEITRAWNVTGIPTVYVIDHTGVIRSKTARGAVLDRLVDDLVKKAESEP